MRVVLASQNKFESIPSPVFWKSLRIGINSSLNEWQNSFMKPCVLELSMLPGFGLLIQSFIVQAFYFFLISFCQVECFWESIYYIQVIQSVGTVVIIYISLMTGKPGMLQFIGKQKVRHDLATE